MVEQFPQFRSAGNTVKTFTRQVRDPQNLDWTDVTLALPVAKDILKTQPGLGRGRSNNLRVTNRAFTVEQDLVSQCRSFVCDTRD
ncbi:hypothetical protein [Lolliginicoccus suaedae]|uniref:hypothetical protein n=1 Tax=Lolliginicoccus suaedae TaxID=2605429 RepID=UPI0011EEA24C|nr:hypothetical protein [Lolliginicoccus suaedae]